MTPEYGSSRSKKQMVQYAIGEDQRALITSSERMKWLFLKAETMPAQLYVLENKV